MAGAPEVGDDLGELAREKRVAGRPMTIRRLLRPEDGIGCDLVYLGFPDSRRTLDLLRPLLGSRTVTVGECEDFLALGGLVRFVRRDKNVRPQIQLSAATRAGFTIHARLLSASEVIR